MHHIGDLLIAFALIVGLLYISGFQNTREDNRGR